MQEGRDDLTIKVEDRKCDEDGVDIYGWFVCEKIWVKWQWKTSKIQNDFREKPKMHGKTFEDEKLMTKETENSRGWDLTKMVFHQVTNSF